MNDYFVYKYEFCDGSIYIWQTSHRQNRYNHPSQYKNCKKLYRKFIKYNFEYEASIIEDNIDESEIDAKEIYYITKYNSHYKYNRKYGLNLTCGGQGIHDLPYYSKHKISVANKGKHNSKRTEFKKGQTPWNKGIRPNLDYTKQIKAMHNARDKKILCSNGKVYNGSYECNRELGVVPSSVIKCCKGKLKQTGGYKFEYFKGVI